MRAPTTGLEYFAPPVANGIIVVGIACVPGRPRLPVKKTISRCR